MPKQSLKDLDNLLPPSIRDLDLIVLMQFGSHLYGTDGPDSDLDFKGIYLPTQEQILTNRIPKSVSFKTKKSKEEGVKNTAQDIDCEVYSLHYFLKLAAEGQTVALDMLHAPHDWPAIQSDLWVSLVRKRKMFYTKSLKAFVGYARRQAAKYGIKGSRLAAVRSVVDFMKHYTDYPHNMTEVKDSPRLADVWDELPRGEHIHDDLADPKGMRMYQVCGKSFQETAKLSYVRPILKDFLDEYGKRAKKAEQNEGIDWKAVSHALRAAAETLELLTMENIFFPLRQATFLKAVKDGKLDFKKQVQPILEIYMHLCEDAAEMSNYPERVSQSRIDKWLVKVLKDVAFKSNN